MTKSGLLFIFLTLSLLPLEAKENRLDFSLHKLESGRPGPTILVVGGIQGDEPGGFNAAALLVTDYKISTGNVWVVPNLNFESIIKRSRGVHGDMNRKFLHLNQNDPEYNAVQKIKSIILEKQVDLILNLHDGSGFYNEKYIDRLRNPNRWGQSIIIDQAKLSSEKYGKLMELAKEAAESANQEINNTKHLYRVKNTHTREGNKEMEKTLTYFAVQNNKPAFGIEASKQFLTHERVYYHLLLVEAFFNKTGIKFERNFNFAKQGIKDKIDNNIKLSLYDSKIYLDMADARNRLRYVPLRKDSPIEFEASNPLVTIVNDKKSYKVRYGNRHVSLLLPEYFDYDSSLSTVSLEVDGEQVNAELGTIIPVRETIKVKSIPGYRANIIGYKKSGVSNETDLLISKNEILSRFSVDKMAKLFRLEFYREDKFCGMVLLNFKKQEISNLSLSAVVN
ncbi:MAG: succinylglutamate desuccinylase/aspartoacylase family protein [Gammaproteobacteria bacterium]|nr:succinylglutamate desuccinylase/aspartoacylase family protein [Gammaproteobacteria bacterium]